MSHTTHHDDCGCLTANYERRLDAQKEAVVSLEAKVATLEAELAEAIEAHADCALYERGAVFRIGHLETALMESSVKRCAAEAHANALRDALEEIADANGCEVEGCTNRDCVAGRRAKAALAQTPAASLAALKAEVLERAAAIADDYDGDGVSKSGQYTQLGDGALTRSDIAKAIRALAAQEVKP